MAKWRSGGDQQAERAKQGQGVGAHFHIELIKHVSIISGEITAPVSILSPHCLHAGRTVAENESGWLTTGDVLMTTHETKTV